MKKITLTICAATVLLIACNSSETKENKTDSSSTSATTADGKKNDAWVPVDSATMWNAMMAYGTPGPMHKMIASWNGTWAGETTMWDFEGAAPKQSTGTAVNTMVMGGKYQSSRHSGKMGDMPFEGMSIMGYDNATKQFVSTWIDSWSTGIMTMSGTWDEATKTLTMVGTTPDIVRPGKVCSFREVFSVIDDNTQNMIMYGPDQKTGKEFKMMEMKMTRKK